MIRACLLVIAGGFAAQHSRVPISWDLCKLLLVASVLLLTHPRTRNAGLVLFGCSLFVQSGLAIIDDRLDERFAGDSLLTQVRVVDFPEVTGSSVVLLLAPVDDARLPPLSKVSWFEPPLMPTVGDTWELELRLRLPRGHSNPTLFDYEAWLFRQRVHASGYVVPGKRNRLVDSGGRGIVDGIRRQFVDDALNASESPDVAAILSAVGVGTRHLVSRPQWERYALSGTSHLVAISGLHIGLAASSAFLFFSVVLGLLRITANSHVSALLCGVAIATSYAALSGFDVPAQRATLMLLIAVGAIVRRRQVDPARVLAAAALAVYLLDPVATMSPGFHLSFVAVLLLLWLARRSRASPRDGFRALRIVTAARELVIMQAFLFFGLLPLTVLIFQRVAFLSMPANLLAVPLFSLVTVPLTLTGLIVGRLSEPAGTAALQVAASTIAWTEAGMTVLLRLPFADITVAALSGHMWLVVFVPALWVLLPRGWPGRGIALLAVAAIVAHAPKSPPRGCVDAHVLDVGQGLAVVMQTERHFLVFDTGVSFRGGGSIAEQVVSPFLWSRAASRIDWLIVSHADIDHSGGVKSLEESFEIGTVLAGEPLRGAFECHAGQDWTQDGLRFRVLHPRWPAERVGNNASCVLLVSGGQHGILLTGDIEAKAEHEIVARGLIPEVDVVVVPHHGSLTSSSMPFVDATSPLLAIVSAGYGNRWGFPKAAVVERWRSVGATVVNTATAGAVSLRLCADGGLVEWRKDRHARRRFWREGAG